MADETRARLEKIRRQRIGGETHGLEGDVSWMLGIIEAQRGEIKRLKAMVERHVKDCGACHWEVTSCEYCGADNKYCPDNTTLMTCPGGLSNYCKTYCSFQPFCENFYASARADIDQREKEREAEDE